MPEVLVELAQVAGDVLAAGVGVGPEHNVRHVQLHRGLQTLVDLALALAKLGGNLVLVHQQKGVVQVRLVAHALAG